MKATGIFLLLLVWHTSFSQWTDNFSDGDFSINPSWNGTTADFSIESNVLRLSAPAVSSSSYLSTHSESINNASWQFSLNLAFNPSSSNYTKVYLVSSNSNLSEALNGYFVKAGNTADEISLYRQDGLTEIEIIDGLDGRVDFSVVNITILVTRTANGEWQLSSKLDADTDWLLEGSIIDQTYMASSYFGLLCTYTSTRSTKFYFDDIIVTGTPFIDSISPKVDTVYTISQNEIAVLFNEPVEYSSASNVLNYTLNNNSHPLGVAVTDSASTLNFQAAIPVLNELAIQRVLDFNNNMIADTAIQVIYVDPELVNVGNVIINEVFADPSPREDLPEAEYIELFNNTSRAIDMTGWSLSDRISTGILGNYVLLPDSFLILSSSTNSPLFSEHGDVMDISPWPSLNNTGDSLTLTSEAGEIIDLILYDDSWYRDSSKGDGGWSIELINPNHACSGPLNWMASNDIQGGTPGRSNSVLDIIDLDPPELVNFEINVDALHLIFNEPIQSAHWDISSKPVNSAIAAVVTYNELLIQFEQPFASAMDNEITVASVEDCFGNSLANLTINFIPDFEPPEIDTVFSLYPNMIEVYFNEAIQPIQIEDVNIEPMVNLINVDINLDDSTHVTILFEDGLKTGDTYILKVKNIHDLHNNINPNLEYVFTYQPLRHPVFGEVLITEIMADPSPSISLPEYEYLELTNKSEETLSLKNLLISDGKDVVPIPTGIIRPKERVILTKTTAVVGFTEYAKTIGIPNWPTLNNSEDEITLLDTANNVINHVAYSKEWYDNDEKSEGGWSLELMDEANYCQADLVWTASNYALGGTPGSENSVITPLPDSQIPHIIDAFAISNDSIIIQFNEPLSPEVPNVNINDLDVLTSVYSNYSMNEVVLNVEKLLPSIKYELIAEQIVDCAGNINSKEERIIILPEKAEEGDVVVCEVLFNPIYDGSDFIELYNNSAKYLSMAQWKISNGSSSTVIESNDLLPPYSFRVFTNDPENILDYYPKAIPESIFKQAIPSLPNSLGDVALINDANELIDSIHYDETWHFPYLENLDGVSLSKIDISGSGIQPSNWISGSSNDNYATPGYSSIHVSEDLSNSPLSIEPTVINPNGNGTDDFATITLSRSNLGSLVTLNVYNLNGRLVKELANNTLVTSKTRFIWDGTDHNGGIVSLGHYFIISELISSNGTTERYREKIVVATGF